MRKKFFIAAFVAMAGICGYSSYRAQSLQYDMEGLQLTNAEALSFDESKICCYNKVKKDQDKNKLECSGEGRQCCILD